MDPTPQSPSGASSDSEPPKKYIRTFEGDMEMLKKGHAPDLKPLASKPAPERQEVPAPPQAPPPPPKALVPPPPQTAPLPPSPPPPPQKPRPSPLQTYSHDFTERVKATRASTATILAAEQDAAKGRVRIEDERPRGGTLSFIAGLLFLVVGGGGAYLAYTHYLVKTQPVALPSIAVTPIFVDERETIKETEPALALQAIKQSLTRPLTSGTVRLLATEAASTSVFSALQLPAPGVLLRNVAAPGSMAGIVNVSGTLSPFFILAVSSYGETFSGMLQWESTMSGDLTALFPPYETAGATSTTATTTSSTPIFSVFFHDEVVNNHDTRVYRDVKGRSVLIYGYWDQRTLIIARDPAAFSEIITRLSTSRTR